MGQRMPDVPIVYGDDCVAVWPAGKTPKYLYLRPLLIETCPGAPKLAPNGRVFTLTQHPTAACVFSYDSADWDVSADLNAIPDKTSILINSKAPVETYFGEQHPETIEEGKVYHNNYVGCPVGRGGFNGIIAITWTPQATELLENIVIEKGTDLFMELFPLPDGKLVYKFCRLQDATNVKILFEPD